MNTKLDISIPGFETTQLSVDEIVEASKRLAEAAQIDEMVQDGNGRKSFLDRWVMQARTPSYFAGQIEHTGSGIRVTAPPLQSIVFCSVENIGLMNSLTFRDEKCMYILRVNRHSARTGTKNRTKNGYYRTGKSERRGI